MHTAENKRSGPSLIYAIVTLTFVAIAFCMGSDTVTPAEARSDRSASRISAPSATFAADPASLGAIPDSDIGSPVCQNNSATFRDVTFTVTGMSGPVMFGSVSFSASHTFLQDLEVSLRAPGGSPSHLLFSATGTTSTVANSCAGSSNDLSTANTYTFSDISTANWWTTAAANPVPTSSNRTVVAGPSSNPPATTSMGVTFGLAPANGVWTLRFRDRGAGDTGTVTAASLTIFSEPPFGNVLDFDGDGRSDASVVRNTGGGPTGQVTWFNLPTGGGAHTITPWGIATDFFTPGNFDGDGKTDIAVWRSGAPGAASFYILQSSTSTLRVEQFGQSGDDPSVIGDYDGDGKDDIAVYRTDPILAGPSKWYWRTTLGGPVFGRQWGQPGDAPAPGDYDGDGKNDFAVRRNQGGGQTGFHIFNTSLGNYTLTLFGAPSDLIVPGDYDGDGKTDIATVRNSGGQMLWLVLPSGGGPYIITPWGTSTTDFTAPGDYDGDGKLDRAVWRPSLDPLDNNFWIRRSSDAGTTKIEWGQNGDYPIANYNTH